MSGYLTPEQELNKAAELRTAIYKMQIERLAAVYGSVRAVGRALSIDHVYLQRLASGEKQNPSNAVLRKLGLL